MQTRGTACLVALCLSVVLTGPAHAQEDLVFVGTALSDLRNAVHPAALILTLRNPVLKRDLGGDPSNPPPLALALLLVPRDANVANPVIRKVYNDGKTKMQEHSVDAADIEALRQIASDGLVILLRSNTFSGSAALTPQDFNRLERELGRLPTEKQEVARRYVGAVLADRGVQAAESTPYVAAFRKTAEEKLVSSIRSTGTPLETGRPYGYGTRPLTERHVAAVASDMVSDFQVDGHTYKKAWVGSSVIVSKPTSTVTFAPKTGIEKMQFRPDVATELKKGNDLPAKPLGSISRRH